MISLRIVQAARVISSRTNDFETYLLGMFVVVFGIECVFWTDGFGARVSMLLDGREGAEVRRRSMGGREEVEVRRWLQVDVGASSAGLVNQALT